MLTDLLLLKLSESPKNLHQIAIDAELSYSTVHGFYNGHQYRVTVETAEKLANAIGFKLTLERK